jgi:hypothetical protein
MTRNQLHGKKFEDLIKACGLFSGAADGGRTVTAKFDIEARFDKSRNLPTSIKSTGSDTISLSDARRFWKINEKFRMLVGRYEQEGDIKTFQVIHEFLLSENTIANLRGDISLIAIDDFHSGISLKNFPIGEHQAAREWSKNEKQRLSLLNCPIVLNPKVDSKTQRRLQCSVSLSLLIEICESQGEYFCHSEWIGDFRLPLQLNSSAREF